MQALRNDEWGSGVLVMWFAADDVITPVDLYQLALRVARGVPVVIGADLRFAGRVDVLMLSGDRAVYETLTETLAAAEFMNLVAVSADPLGGVHHLRPGLDAGGDGGAAAGER